MRQQLSVPVIGEDGDSKAFSKWIFNQIHISTPKAEIQLKTDEKLGHTDVRWEYSRQITYNTQANT